MNYFSLGYTPDGSKPYCPLKVIRIMKLTFILLVSLSLGAYAKGNAQSVSLSVKDAKLEQVLAEIGKQTQYRILYNDELLQTAKSVSLNVKGASITNALESALKSQNLTYRIIAGTITIAAKKQQTVPVKGTVRDSTGVLAGVSVALVGASGKGTVTDANGQFSMNVPEDASLVFRFMGYRDQEVLVNGRTNIEVVLKAAQSFLDEVMVVGYGTQKRATVTGAINQVGAEVFENRPIVNAAQALQGAIPNLNITFSDGRPDRGGTFNVRGFTSINGGGPLILIDGAPGEIDLINPQDIEKVTVLKDASSAAIYGARASFGVVLVTTKSGKKGGARINYSNNFGFNQTMGLPTTVDALTTATIQNDAYRGYSGNDNPDMLLVMDYLKQRQADPSLPELGTSPTGNFIRGSNTNWYDAFYNQNQFFSKHMLNISGASDKVNYYLSGGYTDQDGAFRTATDNYKRYNLRAKVEAELKPWLKVYNNAEFSEGNYDTPNKFVNTGGNNVYRFLSLFANPYEAIKTADGNWTQAGALTFGQLEDGGRTLQKNRMLRNTTGARLTFLKDALHVNADFTASYHQLAEDIQSLQVSYESRPGVMATYPNPNYYNSSSQEIFHSVANLYADYAKSFAKHHFNVLVGASQELDKDHSFYARKEGNITSSLNSLNLASGEARVGDNRQVWGLRSLFGRLSYNFDERYLLEFNGRYDGTSRFPKSDRFGFFPSISGGWVLSEETFFSSLKNTIDNFKIRASYGSLGNQQVSAYPYIATMSLSQAPFILDGSRPLNTRAPGLVSPTLTWETATTFDVGFDMSLLKNRLQLGFDWYERNTRDMLTKSKTLPAVLGAVEPQTNAADLATKGWEISARWESAFDLGDKPFRYNIGLVLSDNQSKITRYDNPSGLFSDYYVGERIGEIWGYTNSGFFKTDDEYLQAADQSKVSTIEYQLDGHPLAGDIRFADLDGNGVIDFGEQTIYNPGDMRVIGNTSPRYAYGINLGFNWGDFDLSAFFQGIGKRDFWPGSESGVFWGTFNRWNQPIYEHLIGNYWTPENPDAYFPRLRAYQALAANRSLGTAQSAYLQDASYLRLKNLTIGYNLPAKWINKLGLTKIRFFVSGQNLVTWTKLSEAFDPESIGDEPDNTTKSGNGFVYPMQRTYVAGLDISF